MKKHLATLLRYKKLYWQKRYTVNRVKFGDECTNFFHAMATVSHRKNAISSLKDDNGNLVTDHETKAAMLYSAFKSRMGVSNNYQMQFDLHSLIQP